MTKKLKVEVKHKEEILWEKVRDEAKILIENSQNNMLVQKAIKEMAEEKLKAFPKK